MPTADAALLVHYCEALRGEGVRAVADFEFLPEACLSKCITGGTDKERLKRAIAARFGSAVTAPSPLRAAAGFAAAPLPASELRGGGALPMRSAAAAAVEVELSRQALPRGTHDAQQQRLAGTAAVAAAAAGLAARATTSVGVTGGGERDRLKRGIAARYASAVVALPPPLPHTLAHLRSARCAAAAAPSRACCRPFATRTAARRGPPLCG